MIYVMSDIHGNMQYFNSVMKKIDLQPKDTLYILGDVIDRHPDGIKILRRIMAMPNAKMLLGNHEYMMLNSIDETGTIKNRLQYSLWSRNCGNITLKSFKHQRISVRKDIYDYLKSLPINIKIEVEGKKYLLAHAAPVEMFNEDWYEYDDEVEFAVWYRWHGAEIYPKEHTLVIGHTYTYRYNGINPLQIYHCKYADLIAIDCGSGFPPPEHRRDLRGRLSCLRLDDMKEFYSDEVIFDE